MSREWPRKRFIYFIRRKDGTGPIKIGYSRQPDRRAYEMSFANRPKLEVIAQAPGVFADEGGLHKMFASSRLHGEWFDPTHDLMSLIEGIQQTGEAPAFFLRIAA